MQEVAIRLERELLHHQFLNPHLYNHRCGGKIFRRIVWFIGSILIDKPKHSVAVYNIHIQYILDYFQHIAKLYDIDIYLIGTRTIELRWSEGEHYISFKNKKELRKDEILSQRIRGYKEKFTYL